MVCTWNGIEFVFNNQTNLVWLLFTKTLCGIELCSFNKILHCMQIPIIIWSTGMKICLTGHLTDVSWQLCFLGVCICIRVHICDLQYDWMWCDMAMNSITFSHDSCSYGTHECIELWMHLKIWFALNSNEIQLENKFIKK